ncbi:hypothetical protein LF65_05300 [Clostridium beijerinckii]|uniref:Uncharacterized protein n=1 Tax=Clostridium beijerinckii TaxID=1520 RepID=A0A0B5QUB4_CLOBE|nr:hypothetical protein [Clostridium beijerinckii]AJH01822.1 hypothetical protein LF65_05300 [Clostridium beijerinckii]
MENSDCRKRKYYEEVLRKHKNAADFYTVHKSMFKNMPDKLNNKDSIIYGTSISVIAPTLISYVLHVLQNSKKRGLERLYFLSRDGYIMYRIAIILCDYYKIDIECKYLYVSRRTLRAPLYSIDSDEAMKYFCENGARISARVILKRAGISNNNEDRILDKLNIKFKDKPLNEYDLTILGKKLRENKQFMEEALNYSKLSYNNISEYFLQEGLFDKKAYAIVDSGWIGSMQRNIRQILSYRGINKRMLGYYFGMYKDGKEEDGEYNCFYFSNKYKSLSRVLFNNNLFECMCSANHGMTIGYSKNRQGLIEPILKEYHNKWNVDLQLETIIKFTEEFVKVNKLEDIRMGKLHNITKKLLVGLMMFPNISEASVYGSIPFCDDSTEGYMINLANILNKRELRQYNIVYKIYEKMFYKKRGIKLNESFWINGTIQIMDISHKKLFNLNCIICEYIHYLSIKIKE